MTDVLLMDAGGASIKMVDVGNGVILPPIQDAVKEKAYFEGIPNYEIKDDDVMLLSYSKTGTNWLYEILKMILNRSAERIKTGKGESMLEIMPPERVNALQSPRVLNTHVKFRYLPIALRTKQTKTVLILRNPKDTAVSHYNHCKGLTFYDYDGEWKNFIPLWIQGKYYLREFDKAIQDGVGFPLHVMYFEDLYLNGPAEIDRLVKFLKFDVDEKLQQDILDNCNFKKMAAEKTHKLIAKIWFKDGFSFFRKGEIDDWRNWFTVADNDMFDKIWRDEMKGCTRFPFKYDNDK